MNETLSVTFDQCVRALRQEQGWKQVTFSERCGFYQIYLSRTENGQDNPTLNAMEVIAIGLGLAIFQLFDWVRLSLEPAVAIPDAASVEIPSPPETPHSKPMLCKCQPVRRSADMADTPSDPTSSAVASVTLLAGGRTALAAGQPTPLLTGVVRSESSVSWQDGILPCRSHWHRLAGASCWPRGSQPHDHAPQ